MVKHDLQDILADKYCNKNMLKAAEKVLLQDDQSEEAFLGAQAILMINGLI